MWHKAIWKGHPMRLELTRVGLLTITPPEVPLVRSVFLWLLLCDRPVSQFASFSQFALFSSSLVVDYCHSFFHHLCSCSLFSVFISSFYTCSTLFVCWEVSFLIESTAILVFNEYFYTIFNLIKSAGSIEYTDSISAVELTSHNECPVMTRNNLVSFSNAGALGEGGVLFNLFTV